MKRSLSVAVLIALLPASGSVSASSVGTSPAPARTNVIYIPREFPGVCGWSLTEDRAVCPEGVTAQAEAFCEQGLRGLDAVRSALGLPDCQGEGELGALPVPGADSLVQLILLVDDTSPSAQLLGALGPILQDHDGTQMIEPSFRAFADSLSRTRQTLVVGEQMFRHGGVGGQQMPTSQWQDQIRRLTTQGGSQGQTEQTQQSTQLPGGAEPSSTSSDQTESDESTTTSSSRWPEEPSEEAQTTTGPDAESRRDESGTTSRRPSTQTPRHDAQHETRNQNENENENEAQSRSSNENEAQTRSENENEVQTQRGEPTFTSSKKTVAVSFKRSFVQWRDDVGRELAQEISRIERSQAYSTARNSSELRRLHAALIEAGKQNGDIVYVRVTVVINDSDGTIESVSIDADAGA